MQWSVVTWRSASPARPEPEHRMDRGGPSNRCSAGRCLRRCRRLHRASARHIGDLEKLGACWLASTIEALFRKKHDCTVMERMFSLEALMSNLTLFEAGDPRDYLYAILFLANDVFIQGSTFTHPLVNFSRAHSPTLERTPSPFANPHVASQDFAHDVATI